MRKTGKFSRTTKYDPDYCDVAIEFLSNGYSIVGLAAYLNLSRDTIYQWRERYPDFDESIKIGMSKSAKAWEDILLQVARTGKGNAVAAIFGLKNRAWQEWRDRQEMAIGGENVTFQMSFGGASKDEK